MTENLQTLLKEGESIPQKCLAFGHVLGLDTPVSEDVLHGALYDPNYAHNLLVCRGSPLFLQYLLENPPKVPLREQSNIELMKRATNALWRWGKTGFSKVDEETYRRRFNTCLQCAHLVEPPNKLLYKLMTHGKPDEKICNLCGCVASKKARLPTEACPDKRW